MSNVKLIFWKVATLTICLAITFMLASCDKEDKTKEDTAKEDVLLLEEILWISSDTYRHVFKYDSHDRIIKYYYYKEDILLFVNSIIYNKEGDLVECTKKFFEGFASYPERTYKFIKIGNLIYPDYGVFELNEQGLPIKYKVNEQVHTFLWQNGNLVKHTMVNPGSTQYQVISTFTYDNMKSPFYNCKTPKWFILWFLDWGVVHEDYCNVNNIIDQEVIMNEEIFNSDPIDYTYNDNGFPSTSKQRRILYRYLKR